MKLLRTIHSLIILALLLAVPPGTIAKDQEPVSGQDAEGRTIISDEPWTPVKAPEFQTKVVYGTDDRLDVYQESDPSRLQWVNSVCGLLNNTDLTNNGNGTYTISLYNYLISGVSGCLDEPFRTQPTAMFCTGFLVGEDLIATAGHCYSASNISNVRFVFGFKMQNSSTPVSVVNADQVYQGVSVVARQNFGDKDYSIIRVDRRVTAPGAQPLPIRRAGVVPVNEPVGLMGHPAGLPMKIAFGAETKVYNSSVSPDYFVANLDAFGGNSGSPVFNQATGVVEGILVRGATDYVVTSCFRSNQLTNNQAGEEASTAQSFKNFVPGIGFTQPAYAAGQVATIHVVDDNLAVQTLSVTLTSDAGDTEVVIASDPDNDNVYTANITLGAAGTPATASNGVLELNCGGTITATYNDANAGASTPRTFSDTVPVDCDPPDASVSIVNVQNDSATIIVEATEPVTGTVELTVDCGTAVETIPLSGTGTYFSVNFSSLAECQDYGVRVLLTDLVGNNATIDNGGSCFGFTTHARDVVFMDTLEPAPATGWTTTTLLGANQWQHRTEALANSPTRVFANAPGLAAVSDTAVVTPPLQAGDLLEFYHTHQFEQNVGTGVAYDGGVLEISTNSGANWSDLGNRIIENGYTGILSTAHSNPLGGRAAWTGGSFGVMQRVRVDLTGYNGTLMFRFRFGSDASVQSGGWLIDDIAIVDKALCQDVPVPVIKVAHENGNLLTTGAPPNALAGTLFGEIVTGEPIQHRFIIYNEGPTYLSTSNFAINGPQAGSFQVTPPASEWLSPGNTAQFTITFGPGSQGVHTAALSFNTNDPSAVTYVLNLQGTGVTSPGEFTPDLILSLLDKQKLKTNKRTGELKINEVVQVWNNAPAATKQAVLTVYRSSKPYLDNTAEQIGFKTLRNLKPPKEKPGKPTKLRIKKVKIKALTQEPVGYLFVRVEPLAPVPDDTHWADNQLITVYPAP